MQPAGLTQSLLSSAERPLMPSWDWSAAFKVAWKHKIWQDCSGIETALRSQVRTASGSHKICRETELPGAAEWVHSLFHPHQEPSKARQVGASKGGTGICRQVCLTIVTFQSHQNKFFFSFVSLVLAPSVPHAKSVSIFHHPLPVSGTAKYLSPESENVMPTLLAVLSQLSLCPFLWGTVLSHTHFLHQTCTGTDLCSWNSLQNPYQGFPSPVTILTHTQP